MPLTDHVLKRKDIGAPGRVKRQEHRLPTLPQPNSRTAKAHAPKMGRCLPLLASPKRSFKVLTSEQGKRKDVRAEELEPCEARAHSVHSPLVLGSHRPWPGGYSHTSHPRVGKEMDSWEWVDRTQLGTCPRNLACKMKPSSVLGHLP